MTTNSTWEKTSFLFQQMHKLLIVFGTRPELIKLAPLINEFRERNLRERLFIIHTNQHKDFTQEDLDYFQIEVDYQFSLIRKDDSLSLLNGLLLLEFNELTLRLKELNITVDCIIGQGDTCTTFSAAQYAFYQNIPFLHIEAGLRTHDFRQPFPEEFFRKTIATIATMHFAPTNRERNNLINEGVNAQAIAVTGNTVIDNLRQLSNKVGQKNVIGAENNLILITIHRRENIKNNFNAISERILHYVTTNPGMNFIWIDNPGYKISDTIHFHSPNLKIIQPIAYGEMLKLYEQAQLIMTDSGGIQEEAACLGIPTIVFRTKTERIEGIIGGTTQYMEDSDDNLEVVIATLMKHKQAGFNTIYGDGYASKRIVDWILEGKF